MVAGEDARAADRWAWGYRPHLDGVRSVAVYLVVAFHAGIAQFTGGFIGVDVFFVLSGYLVTQVLVHDLADHGTFRIGRFYARRVWRLLPAAALNLIVIAVVFSAIGTPSEFEAARRGVTAAFFYVANWWSIRESADYFGADIASNPVAHYWSLAIEEQFYLVWPLLLVGVHRLTLRAGTRAKRLRQAFVGLLGLASVLWAVRVSGFNLDRAYFGTDTRAYQLLAGALLALSPGVIRRFGGSRTSRLAPMVTVVMLGALGGAASSAVDFSPVSRGILATAICVGLIIALEVSDGGPVRRMLSWEPVTYLGRISYGTYLWHWPVIVVATSQFDLSPISMFAITVLVATGIASLSYQIYEQPIRTAALLERRRLVTVAAGLTISALLGLVAVPHIFRSAESRDGGSPVGVQETSAGGVSAGGATPDGTPNQVSAQAAFRDFVEPKPCDPNDVEACTVVAATAPDAPTLLVLGDSHAAMFTPMVEKVARRRGFKLVVASTPGCPWVRDIRWERSEPVCFDRQDEVQDQIIPKVDPDIVVLFQRAFDDPTYPAVLVDRDRLTLKPGSAAQNRAIEDRTSAVVDSLRANGRLVVIVEPIPITSPEHDPVGCLSKAKFLEECRFVSQVEPSPSEVIVRSLAAGDPKVITVDFDRLACPFLPVCDAVIDGSVVYQDYQHLTATWATTMDRRFEADLVQAGLLD